MPPVLLPKLVENVLDFTPAEEEEGGDLGDPLLSANSRALLVPLPFSI